MTGTGGGRPTRDEVALLAVFVVLGVGIAAVLQGLILLVAADPPLSLPAVLAAGALGCFAVGVWVVSVHRSRARSERPWRDLP